MRSASVSSLLYISFFFTPFFHGVKSTNLVHSTCTEAAQGDPRLHYNFCVAALEGVASKDHVKDLQGLGLVALNLIKGNGSAIISHIEKLLKQKSLKPYDKSCLLDCQELYSDAMDMLQEAGNDFRSEDYFPANMKIDAVMAESVSCEDGFKEEKGEISPIKSMSDDMFQLCGIVLCITTMLSI